MHTLPSLLIAASALVLFTLGTLHLVLTFRGNALHPRDPALVAAMQADSPRISRQTSVWRATLGFHASHSLGAMLFGLVYGYLALEGSGFLFKSHFLMGLGLATLCAYLVLAQRYWFKTPMRAILLATVLYGAGLGALLA